MYMYNVLFVFDNTDKKLELLNIDIFYYPVFTEYISKVKPCLPIHSWVVAP